MPRGARLHAEPLTAACPRLYRLSVNTAPLRSHVITAVYWLISSLFVRPPLQFSSGAQRRRLHRLLGQSLSLIELDEVPASILEYGNGYRSHLCRLLTEYHTQLFHSFELFLDILNGK